MELKKVFRNPSFIFLLLLTSYLIVATFVSFNYEHTVLSIIFLIVMLISHFLIDKYYKKISFVNTLLSIEIIYLIYFFTSLVEVLLVIVLFWLLRLFLRYKSMPIINPVVATLLGTYIVTLLVSLPTPFVSWWGSAFLGSWSLLFLAPVVAYGLHRFRKYYYFFFLLLSYILVDTILNGFSWFAFSTGTLYFALGIMFLEIKTSPTRKMDQIVIGILGGIFLVFSYKLFTYPILIAIAFTNVIFFAKKYYLLELKKKSK